MSWRTWLPFCPVAPAWCLALLVSAPSAVRAELLEGFTEPLHTVDVAAGELGIVARVHVKEGQRVEEGELLAELDTDVLESTLEIARTRAESSGGCDAAIAELQLRQHSLEQFEKLMAKGHATDGELVRARADVAMAEAKLKIAQNEKRLAELECRRIQTQIDRRRVRSPITGLVSEVHREPGESYLAGDPRIMTLVNVDQLRVRFQITPRQAMNIAPGDPVPLELPDLDQQAVAKIERISPVMDAKSGTVEVIALIDNTDPKRILRSGMRCTWQLGSSDDAIGPIDSVPTHSVTSEHPSTQLSPNTP